MYRRIVDVPTHTQTLLMLSRSLIQISLLFAVCVLLGCSSGGNVKSPEKASTAPGNVSQESDSYHPGPPSGDAAPDVVVKQLFKQHDSYTGPFFQTQDRALVDRYFTKSLADLIWQDAVASKGAVGALDIDPLYGAHLLKLEDFRVGSPSIQGDAATVVASFKNYEADTQVTFELTKADRVWKVDDIKYSSGDTLMKKLTKK